MADDQTERFHHAMLEIYDAAAKLKPPYRASRFKLMVNERGGQGRGRFASGEGHGVKWIHRAVPSR